ncbi:hypothetical protein [Hufsiella ginkgonis]|uniref:Lipocalin-like domain-containing protein n=1 Tax=Hufsiella ginkgonis TaxID=2695274 RepID=A0A7K1XSH8_9SPHI|nr:hypothetical protein [Hufsiella ginkgonis]MXV13827.1 hypothetical protein [Hufsiella ginkgonis]
MKSVLLGFILLLKGTFQESVEELLLGKWVYVKGSYEYYDSAGKLLKESGMNAISNLDIQITKESATIIYSKDKSTTRNYAVTKGENGRHFISVSLPRGNFNYEIASITSTDLILLARQNTSFALGGDDTKQVSYCLVKIYMSKK